MNQSRRTAVGVATLIVIAWLIGGCGSSGPAARPVTHASQAPSRTGAVYADCASATFLAGDFLAKAAHDVTPADINNVTRQGERQAAAALKQGITQIDGLPARVPRTSEDTHLEQELDNARTMLDGLAVHVPHKTTPFPTAAVRGLSAMISRVEGICPRAA